MKIFFNDFSKLLEQDCCQKLKEQYTKIIGVYKLKKLNGI